MPDMCDYINCALKNIYKRCSMYEFNIEIYGAQNEVYNDDWVKSGLIVLCFS